MTPHSTRRSWPLALGLGLGVVAGQVGMRAAYVTRLLISSVRQPLWRSPSALGMPTEAVTFPASDGVMLRGWLIRRANDDGQPAPAVVFVHGWPWNRQGNRAEATLLPDKTVDLLDPAQALHQAGFHVLLFDLRNHGASDSAPPVSFGVYEANDLVGAVELLRSRPEVDGERIGVLGFSMGANTALFGIPRCQPIRAAVAVQPVRARTFGMRFARSFLGPLGPALTRLALPLHEAFGAPPLDEIDPTAAASQLGNTAVLYIQGSGDPWGTLEDVEAMAAATPNARPVVVAPGDNRYDGYLYINQHRDVMVRFFQEHLA
ncbi:MAG: alpha/beta hydrolase [Roseiflexaceae bacterium]